MTESPAKPTETGWDKTAFPLIATLPGNRGNFPFPCSENNLLPPIPPHPPRAASQPGEGFAILEVGDGGPGLPEVSGCGVRLAPHPTTPAWLPRVWGRQIS